MLLGLWMMVFIFFLMERLTPRSTFFPGTTLNRTYMLREGNQVANSAAVEHSFAGRLHHIACHKYASNVVEKCFGCITPCLQHNFIEELFLGTDSAVLQLLTDRSANYVVQAAIAAASVREVAMVNNRLKALLPLIPYGEKIQQRINRRLRL